MNMHTWRLSDKSPKRIDKSLYDSERNFAIPYAVIEDIDLSFKTRATLAFFYCFEKDITVKDITSICSDSARSIRKSLRELEESGYIVRVKAGE